MQLPPILTIPIVAKVLTTIQTNSIKLLLPGGECFFSFSTKSNASSGLPDSSSEWSNNDFEGRLSSSREESLRSSGSASLRECGLGVDIAAISDSDVLQMGREKSFSFVTRVGLVCMVHKQGLRAFIPRALLIYRVNPPTLTGNKAP